MLLADLQMKSIDNTLVHKCLCGKHCSLWVLSILQKSVKMMMTFEVLMKKTSSGQPPDSLRSLQLSGGPDTPESIAVYLTSHCEMNSFQFTFFLQR